jgi:hypothetical protein
VSELDLFGREQMHRTARFAGAERIELGRRWGPGPKACMIGCNPSTADAFEDDPTCRWWIEWCRHFGFGSLVAVNLYPFCTSSPAECRRVASWEDNGPDWHARDKIHHVNLPAVVASAKAADQVFACWGAIAWDLNWIDHVVEEIQSGEASYPDLWCWGKTATGAPKHPMARGVHRIDPHQAPIIWRAVA